MCGIVGFTGNRQAAQILLDGFQDINDIPGTLPEGRTKPWGTGQAVLAAKDVIKTPFIVINADDYYGKEGFKAVHEYLVNGGKSCMASVEQNLISTQYKDFLITTLTICKGFEYSHIVKSIRFNINVLEFTH